MKLNLGCGTDIRIGYINIDRLPLGKPPMFKQGDFSNLDWLTQDESVEEIIAIDCLEYLSIHNVKPAIMNWAQKLCQNGIIKILIPDCHVMAIMFGNGQYGLEDFLRIMFGQQQDNDNRMSAIDALTLCSYLTEAGLKISTKRYEGIAFYVEAVKC
jgi:predicted SAM-dependent methyltransferase